MRRLLNTLFVTTSDAYLSLDGENVVVSREKQELGRFPLHNLCGVISFSYAGASPALLGACAERDIDVVFCSPQGRFLARTAGITGGNVLLRREQYRAADDPCRACRIARYMVYGKLYNARWNIERTRRDHGMRVDEEIPKCVGDAEGPSAAGGGGDVAGQPARAGGRGSDGLLLRAGRHDPAGQAAFLLPQSQPASPDGSVQRHAVLCLQHARPRLRLGAGERGAG